MSNQKTEQFLDDWRRLESAAERVVGSDSRTNAVLRLCRDPRFSAYRDELDYCREVRNLLSHQAKVDGEYPVYPSDAMLALLQTVLRRLEDPPVVTEVMTPTDRLILADENANVLDIMRRMKEKGLSHIPLLKKERVVGVFSVETVFQSVLDGRAEIGPETRMKDLAAYLPLEKHMNHEYRFVHKGTTLQIAESMFQKGSGRARKLKLLLVTKNGEADTPLLGVVTPYDLMGQPE